MAITHISPYQLQNTSPEELSRHLAGDPAEAALWIKAAAEQGMPDAQALLGQILLDGRGISLDMVLARYWFAKAADQGHPMGLNMLGRCHELGWGGGIDFALAALHFKQSAELGLDWGMYNYANLLLHGNGVEKDEALALEWYCKAAALGNAKSLNVVGRFYEEGWLVSADRAIAADYYRQAAEGDDFRGQYNYALLLAEQGLMKDAIYWMEHALAAAHLKFTRVMAENLLTFPNPEFHRIGMLAHEKCCELGSANDYYNYALVLQKDKRKAANTILAETWLMRAAAQGHDKAKRHLKASRS
ncbi:tetratricopeptide repeat protein [Methyloradius palustris]|uniref:Sel1 repeat family protein n=1 Tax=Methyloradius palustris TaxID=2778876 RepID=A0A8D5G9G9_9PROT|nr:tetratricopeptide repeat protein [Methyloradius palustris]BCM25582.1 hypothetical protein ZMTM_18410 [Methyloradius palustris]